MRTWRAFFIVLTNPTRVGGIVGGSSSGTLLDTISARRTEPVRCPGTKLRRLARNPQVQWPGRYFLHDHTRVADIAVSITKKRAMKDIPAPFQIEAARTANGGWTKETLAQWGVPWPPPKGWRKELEAQWLETSVRDTVERFGDVLKELAKDD